MCCSFQEDSGIPTIHVTTLSLSASVSQPYLHTEASAPLFLPLSVSSLLHEPDTAARNHAYELYTIPVVDTPHILAHHLADRLLLQPPSDSVSAYRNVHTGTPAEVPPGFSSLLPACRYLTDLPSLWYIPGGHFRPLQEWADQSRSSRSLPPYILRFPADSESHRILQGSFPAILSPLLLLPFSDFLHDYNIQVLPKVSSGGHHLPLPAPRSSEAPAKTFCNILLLLPLSSAAA